MCLLKASIFIFIPNLILEADEMNVNFSKPPSPTAGPRSSTDTAVESHTSAMSPNRGPSKINANLWSSEGDVIEVGCLRKRSNKDL